MIRFVLKAFGMVVWTRPCHLSADLRAHCSSQITM